jgi:hypothetical protein
LRVNIFLVKGSGSRVRIVLGEAVHFLHTPHPNPTLPKYAVRKLREFLEKCGITPF